MQVVASRKENKLRKFLVALFVVAILTVVYSFINFDTTPEGEIQVDDNPYFDEIDVMMPEIDIENKSEL
jgi:hypothetical protein